MPPDENVADQYFQHTFSHDKDLFPGNPTPDDPPVFVGLTSDPEVILDDVSVDDYAWLVGMVRSDTGLTLTLLVGPGGGIYDDVDTVIVPADGSFGTNGGGESFEGPVIGKRLRVEASGHGGAVPNFRLWMALRSAK